MTREAYHRTYCPEVSYSLFDPGNAFRGVTGSAARPTAENCEELIAQLISMPSVPLQHDYSLSGRETLLYVVPGLKRSNHLAPLLVRSLPQLSLDKRRCLRDATR